MSRGFAGLLRAALCGAAALLALTIPLALAGCGTGRGDEAANDSAALYLDGNDGANWPGYGRTFGQQHYSPLDAIDLGNVRTLGLAWSLDLPSANSATQPIAVDGTLYFATGLSVIHAVDVVTGKELWRFDPGAAEQAGLNLRLGWGVRGISWWNGKIYTGTQDGRLIAVDAKTGKQVWSAQTFARDYPAHINGAPRVFAGKVVVGYASTTGATRGYVTAYDAETGKQLWRFYVTPGDPAKGFENPAMAMAARTWAGEWWRFGGGADVWNAIAYDPETDTVFIGTGSGYPWNRRVRSADAAGERGDNLFVSSIVALGGKDGAYKWHYQTTPGDTWDFDATMDIELADLEIGGKPRKVLIQAPKNGFFYVIDRLTGKLISAEPYTKVTWASRVDLATGRPVEAPGARYADGKSADIWPTGVGGHNWMPMAYSARTKLVYIPEISFGTAYGDSGIDLKTWVPPSDRRVTGAIGVAKERQGEGTAETTPRPMTGSLIAWDPVAQRAVWKVPYPSYLNGGVLATGGDLVFQGSLDGELRAFDARTGKLVWRYAVGAPILGTPIAYSAGGKQHVTVLTGLGMGITASAGTFVAGIEKYRVDPRSQARRVLTFALGGKAELAPGPTAAAPAADPSFRRDPAAAARGAAVYGAHCSTCHGSKVIGVTHGPDLRRSATSVERTAFEEVLLRGALVPAGMPSFAELKPGDVADLRQYIRERAADLREQKP